MRKMALRIFCQRRLLLVRRRQCFGCMCYQRIFFSRYVQPVIFVLEFVGKAHMKNVSQLCTCVFVSHLMINLMVSNIDKNSLR